MINQNLFMPINEELSERLHNVVISLVADIDKDMVTRYAKAVLQNHVDFRFKNTVQTKYKEQYGEVLTIPDIALLILECCILRQVLITEEKSESIKAQYSLMVRNCAVARKGKWNGIVCAKWLIDIFNYYEKYSNNVEVGAVSYNSLLTSVVPNTQWNETGLEITEPNVFNQIRSLCVAGIRGKFNAYVESPEFRDIGNPYAQVYVLVKKMVSEWKWQYVSSSPVEKLIDALDDDYKKRKKLSKIVVDVLSGVAKEFIVMPNEASSILLLRINDGKDTTLDDRMFSVLEFGVYLYYEMLLENFNN